MQSTAPGSSIKESVPPGGWRSSDAIFVTVATGVILLIIVGQLAASSHILFDDSFITYRYARNLAEGLGLVWNPGEATEGYTNFLLVLFLAPFLAFGADPLLVTRAASIVALAGMAALAFRYARLRIGADGSSAVLVAACLPVLANGPRISMVGLETVLYTFTLLAAFLLFLRFLEHGKDRDLGLAFIVQFLAFLLRPEALLLTLAVGLVVLASVAMGRRPFRPTVRSVVPALVLFLVLPLCVYLVWKMYYFGHLLPNSFHLKVDGTGVFSSGLNAVVTYFAHQKALVLMAIVAVVSFGRRYSEDFAVAAVLIVLYAGFYMTVDTLMNLGNRFLYPVTPVLYIMAAPVLVASVRALRDLTGRTSIRLAVTGLGLLVLTPTLVSDVALGYRVLAAGPQHDSSAIEYRRYAVGQALAEYPRIGEVTIALGDVGIIPYLVPSPVVDIVGLNDSFIAREREYDELVRYLFDQDITLMFHATNKDLTPITYGHGTLGKMDRWVQNPHARWEDFEYVGTVTTTRGHDYQLLLNRDYEGFQEFAGFLQEHIVDRIHAAFDPSRLLPPPASAFKVPRSGARNAALLHETHSGTRQSAVQAVHEIRHVFRVPAVDEVGRMHDPVPDIQPPHVGEGNVLPEYLVDGPEDVLIPVLLGALHVEVQVPGGAGRH